MDKDTEYRIQTKLEDIHIDVGRMSTDIKELRVDVKDHIGRINKAETDIGWLKGHVRIVTVLGVTLIGSVLTYYFSIK